VSVTERLGAQGSWSVAFKADEEGGIPKEVLDSLDYHGHLILTAPALDLPTIPDPLPHSKFTGVLLEKTFARGGSISGAGLIWWLGDENKIGNTPEANIIFSGDTHASAIAKVLTPEFLAGTIYSQAPTTMSGVTIPALVTTPRENLDTVTEYFGTEWTLTPQGLLNAGTEAQLYPTATNPTTIILPREKVGGDSPALKSVSIADASQRNDRRGYATRVILAHQGEAGNVPVTAANLSPGTTYKDLRGNTMVRKKIISESSTDSGLAPTRALGHLAQAVALNRELTLSTQDYEIVGEDFQLGDTVWGYDELAALEDPTYQVEYRGRFFNPTKIRIVGYTYPITKDYGVYYRDKDGIITDLTKYVAFEEGSVEINVGAFGRKLVGDPNEQLGPRVTADASIPGIPVFGTITSQVFTDDLGFERCRVVVPWSTPVNTDATAIVDGAYYELGYKLAGAGTYDYKTVPWGINSNEFTEFPVGANLAFILQASDAANPPNRSEFSAPTVFVASADSTPPGTPATPTVAGNPLEIQVTHPLTLAAGGNLPDDLHHLNVFVGTTSGFTPGPGNYVGAIPATKAYLDVGVSVVETFGIYDATQRWVKVTAVDASGNESAPSAASNTTAQLLSTGHYGLLTVTDAIIGSMSVAKLIAGDISAAIFTLVGSGKFRFGRTSAPYHHGYIDMNGIFSFTNGSAPYTGGTLLLDHNISAGTLAINNGTITGGQITGTDIVSPLFRTSVGAGSRIEIGDSDLFAGAKTFDFYCGGGDGIDEVPSQIFSRAVGSGGSARAGSAWYPPRVKLSGVLQPSSGLPAIQLLGRTWDGAANTEMIQLGFGNASVAGMDIHPDNILFGSEIFMQNHPIYLRVEGDTAHSIGYSSDHDGPHIQGSNGMWLNCLNVDVGLLLDSDGKVAARNNANTGYSSMKASAFEVNSDKRFKRDIALVDTASAVERFRALRPKRFKRKEDDSQTEHWGFIAQDVPTEAQRHETLAGKPSLLYDPQVLMAIHWGMTHDLDARLEAIEQRLAS
jgi:hypothetical protein